MSPRQVCNVIYAHLIAGADEKAQKDFDHALYAPAQGWNVVYQRMAAIAAGAE